MADHAGAVIDTPAGTRFLVPLRRLLVLAGLAVAAALGCALLSTAAHASSPGTPPSPPVLDVSVTVPGIPQVTVTVSVVGSARPAPLPPPGTAAPAGPATAPHRTAAAPYRGAAPASAHRAATGNTAAIRNRAAAADAVRSAVPLRPFRPGLTTPAADSAAGTGTASAGAHNPVPVTPGALAAPAPLRLLGCLAPAGRRPPRAPGHRPKVHPD